MSELGKRLKEAREERNLNLDDLQKITKIQKRYLVGIEEGNYSVMPGKFYVRAFIKQYAESVGLNPEELFEQYQNEIPATTTEQLPEQLSRVRSKRQISAKGSKILDMIPVMLLSLFIIGGVFTIWWFFQNRDIASNPETPIANEEAEYQESNNTPPAVEDEEETNQEEETTAAEGQEEPDEVEEVDETSPFQLTLVEKSGSRATYQLENTTTFTADVLVASGGETWLEITNQKGNRFSYGLLRDGQTFSDDFSQESQIIFIVGRTVDTELKINGEVFEYPFNPADQVKQTITILFSPTSE